MKILVFFSSFATFKAYWSVRSFSITCDCDKAEIDLKWQADHVKENPSCTWLLFTTMSINIDISVTKHFAIELSANEAPA